MKVDAVMKTPFGARAPCKAPTAAFVAHRDEYVENQLLEKLRRFLANAIKKLTGHRDSMLGVGNIDRLLGSRRRQ